MKEGLDGRIQSAFAEETPSATVAALLEEVKDAAREADAAAASSRQQALDPAVPRSVAEAARQAMEQAEFDRDRMQEAERRLRMQLEVARQREREAARKAAYEAAQAERDAVAADLTERWPALEAEMVGLLSKLLASDQTIQRVNREPPKGTAALRSAELLARGLEGLVANGREIPSLARARLPAFRDDPHNTYIWPQPVNITPSFVPRARPVDVVVVMPFEFGPEGRQEFVPMGTQRLPAPLAALAAEKGLALRLDSPDGRRAAAEAARSGDVPPMSRQYEMVRLGELQCAEIDFDMVAWAQNDVAAQLEEWKAAKAKAA